MSLPEEDRVRLRHMRDAARQALQFCQRRTRADLDADAMLRFALLHAVTIVGEAAAQVSDPSRAEMPDLPWRAIVGMRNRLVHAYFDVDADVLWSSVNDKLPELVQRIEVALGAE
jgi:uncharacterized protein with HEPN domain